MSVNKFINQIRVTPQAEGVSPGPSPTVCIFEIEWPKVCHPPAIKQLTRILVC